MACYKPLKAYVESVREDGKKNIKFVSSSPPPFKELIDIPCGQCIGCRLDYSRQWADRCMLELQNHDSAYFVTLTYNDAHVPKSFSADPATGEAGSQTLTLYKRDFQLFMKRLRKRFLNDKIRYFMCGEYGEKNYRPHYHVILFGLHLDDLEYWRKGKSGFPIYWSDSLEECWIDSENRFPKGDFNYSFQENTSLEDRKLGFVTVQDVTWETCAYTARYILKKQKGLFADFYVYGGILPEFTLMSRKPGIARQFYEDHKGELYEFDYVNISTEKGGRKIRPSRYYDSLFDIEFPDEMEKIKKDRKRIAESAQKSKLEKTSLTAPELLAVEERNKMAKIKSLRRNYENGT